MVLLAITGPDPLMKIPRRRSRARRVITKPSMRVAWVALESMIMTEPLTVGDAALSTVQDRQIGLPISLIPGGFGSGKPAI